MEHVSHQTMQQVPTIRLGVHDYVLFRLRRTRLCFNGICVIQAEEYTALC
jgi:hypothetical protein